MKNLALIGFMGTGKSTIGRHAAHVLGFRYVDTDTLIEERAGMPISEMFAREGELAFRELETRIVAELSQLERAVISTGGGLPINPDNLASLKTHSLIVCLWASAETIYDRVRAHSHRPLLQGPEPLEKIKSLLAVREPHYRQADVLLNTDLRSVREVAVQVVHHFHMAQAAHS